MDKITPELPKYEIHTEGGTAVIGDVNTEGGDFVGRDKNIFLFKDVQQLLLFITVVVAVIGSLGIGYWGSLQPDVMNGDFNIAVATFDSDSTSSNLEIGSILGKQLAGFLDTQYLSSDFGRVQVQHKNIGVISSAIDAGKIARKINADLVIYGDIVEVGDLVTVSPKFFVNNQLFQVNIGEINGQYQLGYPIEFSISQLKKWDSQSNEILRQRAAIIGDFVKGLIYLFAGDLDHAQPAFENTLTYANHYGNFEGKEVLYLFASRAAVERNDFETANTYVNKALELNSSYARAYIAKANIFYVQGNFGQAYVNYIEATKAKDQPYGSFILEKAHLGIGNIYLDSYLQATEEYGKPEMLQEALANFQYVVDVYTGQTAPDAYLEELAAYAYFNLGRVSEAQHDLQKAAMRYNRAQELTQDLSLKTDIERHLEAIK